MIEFSDISGGAPEAVGALMDFAENEASVPEAAMIAGMILDCTGRPMLMTLTIMGLFSLLGDRITDGEKHLATITAGFRGALKADVARHKGASA